VLAAAEHSGALLVSLENLYGYGPTAGAMTEDLPLAARTVKGRTRAAMTQELLAAADAGRVRIAIGRASDFFGAGATESSLGERVFGNALAGKRADFIGNPDLPHTYSYIRILSRASRRSARTNAPSARSGTCRAPRPSPPGSCSNSWPATSDTPLAFAHCPSSRCAPSACSTQQSANS
jgi:nucleoside-diphosphate-sugar epimerase